MKSLALALSLILATCKIGAIEPEVVTYKTVGNRDLEVHIFKPEKMDTPAPAIVWYHGGGWNPRGRAGQFFEHGKILAQMGVVSISVDYRGYEGTREKRDITVCVADAKSAFRWVRAHAEELNLDPNRIAVGGGSAGGHLAAAVATLPGHDDPNDDLSIPLKPSLQILFNPALDPTPVTGEGFAPLRTVRKGIAPAIIFHGDADTTVPITQAHDFQTAMEKLGSECVLMAYVDQPHAFFNYRDGSNPYFYKTVGDMLLFLKTKGHLQLPKH